MPTKVTISIKGLDRFQKIVQATMEGAKTGPIAAAFKQWSMRYLAFTMERFDGHSKGRGNWPPLKPATVKRRRKGSSTILRDTGTLFRAITPGMKAPGGLNDRIPNGIRVGFGGPAGHPGGKLSIADIANAHQSGAGNLPVRRIIVQPSEEVEKAMASDMERAFVKLLRITDQK